MDEFESIERKEGRKEGKLRSEGVSDRDYEAPVVITAAVMAEGHNEQRETKQNKKPKKVEAAGIVGNS